MKSPIEEKLAAQIAPMFAALGWTWKRQFRMGPYAADFAIEVPVLGQDPFFIIVEADGFTYHDRTPEQATHDRKRDRWFLRSGVTTIRFSSAEIFKNAEACSTELIRTISALIDQRIVIHSKGFGEATRFHLECDAEDARCP